MAIEVVSIVYFGNPQRAQYLNRSFGSFYNFNKNSEIRHIVIDGSPDTDAQMPFYEKFNVELHHKPGMTFGNRLKYAMEQLKTNYWLSLPDDFHWIFPFPLEEAIIQAQKNHIAEVKLTCRGQNWYAEKDPNPVAWFTDNKVITGEELVLEGDLFVSKRRWFRDFHEQFSLACNLLETNFAKWVVDRIPGKCVTGADCEKWAYLRLLPKRYFTAYYKMWIPAFHFIDLEVEGRTPGTLLRSETQLIPENFEIYNRLYNHWTSHDDQ